MGCSYYERIYLVIEYSDSDIDSKLLSSAGSYFYCADSDSEDAYDREMEKEMDQKILRYGTKVIFQDDEWKITSKDKIKQYSSYINPAKKVKKIYKHLVCEER